MLKKGLLLFVLGLMFYPFCLWAQEDEEDSIELNAFGYPDKELVTIIENDNTSHASGQRDDMPDCNDPQLLEQIKDVLIPYISQEDKSIRNRRHTRLVMKNIKNFTEINSAEIDIKKDVMAADRLVEVKINFKKRNEDIKICKSDNKVLNIELYLMMYYIDKNLIVELVNLTTENPKLVFQKSDKLDIAKE